MSVFVAVLLASFQATAAQQPSAAPAAAVEAPKPKAKKVCKADPATSGTRMTKRLCLTEDEWAERSGGMTESARSGYSGKAEDH